jgi:hypothetical protein
VKSSAFYHHGRARRRQWRAFPPIICDPAPATPRKFRWLLQDHGLRAPPQARRRYFWVGLQSQCACELDAEKSFDSEVHKARSKGNGGLVALKKIIMHNEKDGVGDCLSRYLVTQLLTLDISFLLLRSVKSSFSSCFRTRTCFVWRPWPSSTIRRVVSDDMFDAIYHLR